MPNYWVPTSLVNPNSVQAANLYWPFGAALSNPTNLNTAVADGSTSAETDSQWNSINHDSAGIVSTHAVNPAVPLKFQFYPPNLSGKRFVKAYPMVRGKAYQAASGTIGLQYLNNGAFLGRTDFTTADQSFNNHYWTAATLTGANYYDSNRSHELLLYWNVPATGATFLVTSLRMIYEYANAPVVSGVTATINQTTRVATVGWTYNEPENVQYQYKIDAYRVADAVKVVTGSVVTSGAHTGTVTLPVGALDGDYYFEVTVYSNPGSTGAFASTPAHSPNVHYSADAVSGAAVSVRTDTGVGLPVSYLHMTSTTGDVKVRSSLKNAAAPLTMSTIKDFSFSVKSRLVSGDGYAEIVWRTDPTMATRFALQITPTTLTTKVYPGPTTVGTPFTVTTELNKWYTYKITATGSTVIIYRDGGTGAPGEGIPQEVARYVSTTNTVAGNIGFVVNAAVADFTNIAVTAQTVAPPIVADPNRPLNSRDPSYIPQGPKPPWLGDKTNAGHVEYMRLEEEGYSPLYIAPSYSNIFYTDFDLGVGEVRAVASNRPQNDGTLDYTKYHGGKSVSISFLVRGTGEVDTRLPRAYSSGAYGSAPYGFNVSTLQYAAHSVNESVDHLLRWSTPHRRPYLVYKMVDGPEIRLLLRGAQLGRGIAMQDRNNQKVSCQWVAIEGKGYETQQQVANLQPGAGGFTSVITSGTSNTEPIIRFYGPSTNPTIVNDTLYSRYQAGTLALEGSIDAGDFIELNAKNRTVQFNGIQGPAGSKMNMLKIHDWFALEVWRNDLIYSTQSGTGICAVLWHNAHS